MMNFHENSVSAMAQLRWGFTGISRPGVHIAFEIRCVLKAGAIGKKGSSRGKEDVSRLM